MPTIELILYMAAGVLLFLAALAPALGIKQQGSLIAAGLLLAVIVRLIAVAQQVHG